MTDNKGKIEINRREKRTGKGRIATKGRGDGVDRVCLCERGTQRIYSGVCVWGESASAQSPLCLIV